MVGCRIAAGRVIFSFGTLALLAACAPAQIGPTVQSSAGRGKTLDMYQSDSTACKGFASSEVSGMQHASSQRAFDAVMNDDPSVNSVSANDHMMIQQQYDASYSQCMVSKGESVAGYTPAVAIAVPSGPRATPDPVIKATQIELIRLGYLKDGADGFTGPKTRAAISSFEQANGSPPDGTASPRLLAKMQATPTSAAAVASAPTGWVSPTTSAGAVPAAATAPAAPSNWVAPTKSP